MSSRKRPGGKLKKPQRATSNIFAMFDQDQIGEFKEAFNMIDQDRDGFISKKDLEAMFVSLGQDKPDAELETMMKEAPGDEGRINFTMFLTLFGEKLKSTDPEEVIRNAFQCFDEYSKGFSSFRMLLWHVELRIVYILSTSPCS